MKTGLKGKLKSLNMYQILLMITMLLSAFTLIFLMTQKVGTHLDEYLTYGCANHEADGANKLSIEYGVRVNAQEVFDTFFYGNGFNLRNAYVNQTYDNQPPVYFILINLLTFFTNHFLALKTGILLNIVIHLINIALVWLILKELLPREFEALLGAMFYAFIPRVLGNAIFVRAYILLTTFVLALILIFVKNWDKFDRKSFYIQLGIVSVLGTLTHYYFLVYLFYSCVVLGIYLICRRKWKELVTFVGTMAASGIVSVAIFPYMIGRILSGDRGAESLNNATSPSTFLKNIGTFTMTIDSIYGGFLLAIVIIAVLLWLFECLAVQKKSEIQSFRKQWLIILIPCVLYFLTITWVAVLIATRYISAVYPICVILLMGLFDKVMSILTNRDQIRFMAVILLIGIILNGSYKTYGWPELYRNARDCIDTAQKYGVNNECIYVLNLSWHTLSAYHEFIQYQNMTFIRDNHLELLYTEDYSNYDHVVMYFDKNVGQENIDKILTKMVEMNAGIDRYERLHEYDYNVAYYLD